MDDDLGISTRTPPSIRRKRVAAGIIVVAACFFIPLSVGIFRPAILLGTPRAAVSYSAGGSAGSALRSDDDCRPVANGQYRCSLSDSSGSGGNEYLLSMGDRGCWQAVRTSNLAIEGEMPKRMTGCLSIWDWLRPWNRA